MKKRHPLVPDALLIPDKNEVTLTATLEKVRSTCYFGHQNCVENVQDLPNLYGNITHAFEYFEHDVDGKQSHKLCIFDENGLAEERVIDEYKTNIIDGPATRNFLIRKTNDGAKVSVEYETKDEF